MKKILLTIIVSLLMVSVGYCQNQPQLLQLSIKSDRQVYEIGEEIRLTASLKNNSDKEMIVLWKEGGVRTEEINVFEVTIFGDAPSETLYGVFSKVSG